MKKIETHHIKNTDRLAHLLKDAASTCVTKTTKKTLHIIKNTTPGITHPHKYTHFPHLFHQLILCLKGECTLIHTQKKITLQPNSIAILAPHVHFSIQQNKQAPATLLSIFERGYRWTCFTEHSIHNIQSLINAQSGLHERASLQRLTDHASSEISFEQQQEVLTNLLLRYNTSIHKELQYRSRNRMKEARTIEQERMAEALKAMIHTFPKNISIRSLANICSISADHFGKLFKKVYGVPPKEWMTHYRIYQAISLMNQGLQLNIISEKVGFGDQYYFSKVFRKFTGFSPTEYRTYFLVA